VPFELLHAGARIVPDSATKQAGATGHVEAELSLGRTALMSIKTPRPGESLAWFLFRRRSAHAARGRSRRSPPCPQREADSSSQRWTAGRRSSKPA